MGVPVWVWAATLAFIAGLLVYDLLFHGESRARIVAASSGLAKRIRAEFGVIPATLFQLGVLTPLRDLIIDARRKDPLDRADYTWTGQGLDVRYWDNSRFSHWIRTVWTFGPRDPRVSRAVEGRFHGLEIDATTVPRQHEPFFRPSDARSLAPPAMSCEAVFARAIR